MLSTPIDLTPQCEAILAPGEKIILSAEAGGRISPGYKQAMGQIFVTQDRIIWLQRDPGSLARLTGWQDLIEQIPLVQLLGVTIRKSWFQSFLRLVSDKQYDLILRDSKTLAYNNETTKVWYETLLSLKLQLSEQDEHLGFGQSILDPQFGIVFLIVLFVTLGLIIPIFFFNDTPIILTLFTMGAYIFLIGVVIALMKTRL
jgi:hypothetical protein